MRTQDYLQQAVNNLRQAALTRKQEIDELRQTLAKYDQDRREQLNQLKAHEAQTMAIAANSDSDSTKASRMNSVRLMQTEENQAQQLYDQQKRDIDSEISLKTQNMNEINQAAQNIERTWITL